MGWMEIVLLSLVALWLIFTVFFLVHRKGNACCGDCEACKKSCKTE